MFESRPGRRGTIWMRRWDGTMNDVMRCGKAVLSVRDSDFCQYFC
jgi:hypothetical protein